VGRSASTDEIKSAYRKLARKYHPDVNKDSKNAEAKFKEIQEAYEVLRDPQKRKQYNTLGASYESGMDFQMPSGWSFHTDSGRVSVEEDLEGALGGFSEFFEMLFGGARPRSSAASRGASAAGPRQTMRGAAAGGGNGADVETELTITLEDAYNGTTKKVRFQIDTTCPACQGGGTIGGSVCAACKGRGVTPQSKTIEIKIPQGIKDGKRLRLSGQGEPAGGRASKAGDMFVKIKIQLHPVFRQVGSDIHVDLPVAPWEAVLGAEVDVPTLEKTVTMKLPPGTQSGRQLRLRQRGMRTENGRGDEIVHVQILIPTDVTDRERHLFRQLRDISRFRPRVKDRTAQ
jgi:curved DNA-binding protein